MIALKATRLLKPQPRVHTADWLQRHVTMPKGTETGGLPFSLASFPHVSGVLAAFDDRSVRRVVLQWGTRLGKTTSCLSLMAMVAATEPRNMMFASPTKDAAARVIGSRLYPILRNADGVREQLPPEARQSKLHVKMETCQIFVGWSGSESSLADVGAWFGTASEIDKWDDSASNEGDSLKLFVNRFKGFPDHKIIFESTPTIKGRSRIEKLMKESNQHRRYVPCPHCGEFQTLRKGDEYSPGGFRWDRDDHGNSSAEIAFRTAYYECEKCIGKIENHHRVQMLRRGVWCPDGCTVSVSGEITGTATKSGSDTVGFGPLASWYALTETWGSFARAWIQAQKRPRDLQDVVNGYMGETWEIKRTKSTPEKVGERLSTTTRRGTVPDFGRFLTVTVDRQAADGGFVKWVVLAHGESDQAAVVDYGMSITLESIWDIVIRATYPHADGGNGLVPVAAAVDSGWDTKNTYDFCNTHPGMLACKGSSTDLQGQPYKLATVGESRHSSDGQLLFHVNTDFWETDLQSRLEDKLPGEPGALTLPAGAQHDIDFLCEMCNSTLTDKIDGRGNARMTWVKSDENAPNDFRDAVRYGLALGRAWIEERGGMPNRSEIATATKAVTYSGDRRPDGRTWTE